MLLIRDEQGDLCGPKAGGGLRRWLRAMAIAVGVAAVGLGIIVFVVLAVGPSAGAAGGCGGA